MMMTCNITDCRVKKKNFVFSTLLIYSNTEVKRRWRLLYGVLNNFLSSTMDIYLCFVHGYLLVLVHGFLLFSFVPSFFLSFILLSFFVFGFSFRFCSSPTFFPVPFLV